MGGLVLESIIQSLIDRLNINRRDKREKNKGAKDIKIKGKLLYHVKLLFVSRTLKSEVNDRDDKAQTHYIHLFWFYVKPLLILTV